MSIPFDLVIFDCDGVLVDSERISVRVDVEMLTELGWDVTDAEVIERFVGRSEAYMNAAIAEQLGRPLPDDWDDRIRDRYREAFARELEPVEGITEALERITVPTCVASSSGHDRVRFVLEHTGLFERFAGRIFSATDVADGKPAPDLFLHAASRMGAAPGACAVVEDSRYGVEGARAAGMAAFAYAGGLTPRGALEGPGTIVFDDMRSLPDLLAAWNEPAERDA